MSQPRRWCIGLLPLILLWAVANLIEIPRIEGDLGSRAGAAFSAAGKDIQKQSVDVAGRDVTLAGQSLRDGAAAAAGEAVLKTDGVRMLNSVITAAPVQRPFVFTAERDGKSLTLAGFAPDEGVKSQWLAAAAAAFPGVSVVDQMRLAAGAPPQFEAIVAHGLQKLALLSTGKLALSDLSYSLQGQAEDSGAYANLAGLASALPGGARAGVIDIAPPPADPYTFAASPTGGAVTLTGLVPDISTRDKLVAAAKVAFPGANIVDQLAFASGAPKNFSAIAEHGLSLAGKLGKARFSLNGATYGLAGEAADASVFDAALAAVKALPEGASAGTIEILPPEVSPFAWSIRRLPDGRIAIEGVVPDAATREAILAQARKLFPGVGIGDAMRIARTAPNGFALAAALAVEQLSKLKDGRIGLSDGNIALGGEAADAAVRDDVLKAFQSLPGSWRVAANELRIPTPKPVIVAVPPKAPAPVPASLPPEVRVVVPIPAPPPLNVGPPAPETAPAVKVEVPVPPPPPLNLEVPKPPQVSRVEPPQVSRTEPPPAVPEPKAPEPAPPAAPPQQAAVPPSPAPSCSGRLASGAVYFMEGRANLAATDESALVSILEAARRCPGSAVRVAGHANSHGPRAMNIRLSSLRTFAVSRWLQRNGIAKRRIVTIGYGEDRPMEPNAGEGLAKNRRVDISVQVDTSGQ